MSNNIQFDETIELKDNAMLKHKPELFSEWDFEKNEKLELNIYKITQDSSKKAWWECPRCNSGYDALIRNRVRNANCPFCAGTRVNHTNNLIKTHPQLSLEWSYSLNKELSPSTVSKGSKQEAWWICPKCKSEYLAEIKYRTGNHGCLYCAGRLVNETNSLAARNPKLATTWHPTLNGTTTPHDVTYNSATMAWWFCEKGHEWESLISSRNNNGNGCKYCSNFVLKGYSDMWTTNPELANLLANPEEGYKFMQFSSKKVDWKCPTCDSVIKNKQISLISIRGLKCPICSDNMSVPEKVMYCLLKELGVNFEQEKRFDWLNNRLYDFYLSDNNIIIEMHGEQHYSTKGFVVNEKDLLENQKIDKFKREMAIKEGISFYIEIEARESDYEYIKNNILSSKLPALIDLNNVSWTSVFLNCSKSLNIEVLELWETGIPVGEVAKLAGIHVATARNILIKFQSAGKCVYDAYRGIRKYAKSKRYQVHQYDENFKLIKIWDGLTSIKEDGEFWYTSVSESCNNYNLTHKGFHWRYEHKLDTVHVKSESLK